jgi:hypothetical protein
MSQHCGSAGIESFNGQKVANTNPIRPIQLKQELGDTSHSCFRKNTPLLQAKMAGPAVSAWMKQANNSIREKINRGYVAAFVPIA